jgi:hypothetical protein
MAEDVRTDLMTVLFRTAGSRRWGFSDDSFVLIGIVYRRGCLISCQGRQMSEVAWPKTVWLGGHGLR